LILDFETSSIKHQESYSLVNAPKKLAYLR